MSWLFTIIIQPIIYILEFFYSVFYKITDNCGLSVIGLSFVITFFTLPLYMIAEKWQEKERQIQKKLQPEIKRIKETFKGDEQYMILSAFYRQNHYHPLMALRSSFSLLIQIPFFIAAYTFLSNLEALRGRSFFFINDFGNPDETFKIGSFAVNILPIAMTIINCVSGAIYSKGHPLSEKIQIYGCAAVFLVLLYNSPAGLVVYWTMNNILSLVKNVFYKLKNPKKVLYVIVCVLAGCLILLPLTPFKTSVKIINLGLMAIGIVIPFIPFVLKFIAGLIAKNFILFDEKPKLRDAVFFLSVLTIVLLAGLCIPTMIVNSEPANYCYVEKVDSPFVFIRYTMFVAIGLFAFWPICFYELFSTNVKKTFALVFSLLSFCALINTFAFSGEYGSLLPECLFMFEVTIDVSFKEFLIHLIVTVFALVVLLFLLKKFPFVVRSFSVIIALSLSVIIIKNSITINREYKIMERPVVQSSIQPAYHLTKTGRNVVVIMADRLFSPYVNEALNDFPELQEQFDGFVFYPNTISNGWLTMLGAPEVFGGYDFTPYEMNKRTNETLQQKHNQALLTMPVLFNQAGFDTTVANLPYENFFEYPIDNMYKDYPFVKRANTKGMYTALWYKQNDFPRVESLAKSIKRNMIWFSVFKICAPIFRDFIYYNEYWSSEIYSSKKKNNSNEYWDTEIHSSNKSRDRFIDNYAEMDYLPELTDFSSSKDSFILIDNEMNHEPSLLQYPEYVPVEEVTDFGSSKYSHTRQYCTGVATLKKLSDYFEHLKKNDCYDNTRIIIVSDHGASAPFDSLDDGDEEFKKKKTNFVASLIVKDFGSRGPIKKDMAFMVNAEAPYLAIKDIVENPKNPFTGNPLKVENKNDYVVIADGRPEGTRSRHKTRLDIKDSEWITVNDDIFVKEKWSKFAP